MVDAPFFDCTGLPLLGHDEICQILAKKNQKAKICKGPRQKLTNFPDRVKRTIIKVEKLRRLYVLLVGRLDKLVFQNIDYRQPEFDIGRE
jgi:hypothetical protein